MSEIKLSESEEKVKKIATAIGLGHLDAVLSKKDILLAFKPNELDRLAIVLKATRVAHNQCCTGG